MLTVNFDLVNIKVGDTLLDLGCGEGRHALGALLHEPDLHVIALDLNLADLHTAKTRHKSFNNDCAKRCLYTQANGHTLPFKDNTFDHIVCSEVLEHIENYHDVLLEIKRVLKSNGTLMVSVPRYWPEKICWLLSKDYHQVDGGHIRIFKSRCLRNDMQDYAFRFLKRHWAHSLHVPYWWLRCAFWKRGENFWITRAYHKLLVWDLLKRPRITRLIDRALNPIFGKSIVMYFENR